MNMETRHEHSRADPPWLDLMGIDVTCERYLDRQREWFASVASA